MRKGARTLLCVAVYLHNVIDVRALEDGDMRRTQLVPDGPHAEVLAEEVAHQGDLNRVVSERRIARLEGKVSKRIQVNS